MESGALYSGIFEAFAFLALLAAILYGFGYYKAIYEKNSYLKISPARIKEALWICIPVRNERARLPDTIHTLLQDNSPHLRVFVVDDHSTDGTADWVRQKASDDPRIELFQPPDGSLVNRAHWRHW